MHVGAQFMHIDRLIKETLRHHAVIACARWDVDGRRIGRPGLQFHRRRSRTQVQPHLGGISSGLSVGGVVHLENKHTAGRQEFSGPSRIFALIHARDIAGIEPIQPTLDCLKIRRHLQNGTGLDVEDERMVHHGAIARPDDRRPQPGIGLEGIGDRHVGVGHLPRGLDLPSGDLEDHIRLAHGPQTRRRGDSLQRILTGLARGPRVQPSHQAGLLPWGQ